MNEYDKEKQVLDGIDSAKKAEDRIKKKVCDWDDESEVSLKRAEERKEERKRVLDAIVPDRVCPKCKTKIFLDSYWVVKDGLAWCRSCFHSFSNKDDGEIFGSIVKKVVVRVEIDGWKIRALRGRANIGINIFAAEMGWTVVYQDQIERGKQKTVTLDVFERIVKAFKKHGAEVTDSI